jgi:hypothetical protein
MKYNQLHDGDWERPRMRGWKMKCCDCSLVHRVNFKIVKGQIMLQAFRDKRSTAASRRKRGLMTAPKTVPKCPVKVPRGWRRMRIGEWKRPADKFFSMDGVWVRYGPMIRAGNVMPRVRSDVTCIRRLPKRGKGRKGK